MKKQLFLVALLPLMAFAVADWVTITLDDKASVDFPSAPQQKEMSGNAIWVAEVDSSARCMAMVMDFTKFGFDSAGFAAEMAKPEAFVEFRQGVLGQIEGSSLISEKKGTIKGFPSFEYLIDMGKKDSTAFNKMYNKNVFIGTKMYTLSFYERNAQPQDASRNKFFNSFNVKGARE